MVILDLGYLEETSEKSQFTLNVVGGSQVYTDATADNNTAEAVAAGIGDLVYVGVKVYANPLETVSK